MTAELLVLHGARMVTVPPLPADDRIKVIEWIARCAGLPAGHPAFVSEETALTLARVAAHPSLTGDDLLTACANALNLIANTTDPAYDGLGVHARADQALAYLVHGNHGCGSAA